MVGKKNKPSYRIVVAERRSHQRGNVVDIIGFYDPSKPKTFNIDKNKLNYWERTGAKISNSVRIMLKKN